MRTLARLLAGIALVTLATPSCAGSVLQPGGTVGLPVGTAFPEGVFFINTSSYGQRTAAPTGLGVNLTQVVWSTPFSFYDTRLHVILVQPTAYTTGSGRDTFYANSTLISGQLAHAFGNGFHASFLAGFRTPQPAPLAFHEASFEQRGAVTYNANGFNVTVNVINGLFNASHVYPDWLNVDLTATRKFGKLEIGPVAFGSSDISSPNPAYKRQRQIAVGGLVGYNFGFFTTQVYVTRDVTQRNYTGHDTRGWVRLIIPLYKALVASPSVVAARY